MLKLIAICLAFVAILAQNTNRCPNDKLCGDCNGDKCVACYSSYPVNGVCQEPSEEIDNCLQYFNKDTCAKCQHGLRPDSDSCEEIDVENCDVARDDDSSKCRICKAGIQVDTDGKCDTNNKCEIDNCEYCGLNANNSKVCERCNNGYALGMTDGKQECVEETNTTNNCLELTNDKTKCDICDLNYYNNNGKCVINTNLKQTLVYVPLKDYSSLMGMITIVFTFLF